MGLLEADFVFLNKLYLKSDGYGFILDFSSIHLIYFNYYFDPQY